MDEKKYRIDELPSAWNWYYKLSRWEKIKLFFRSDIPYFCDKVYYKITGNRDRVLRRAVTRGVDTLWWARWEREQAKSGQDGKPDKGNDGLDGLAVAIFVLFALLFSIFTKSC